MLNDQRLQTELESLLGHRGPKKNHAVRFKDLGTAVDLDAVQRTAERVARDIAEGYDGANVDLSDLQQRIETAEQTAQAAATDSQNAVTTANNANAYTDTQVQAARNDMAVDFAAAQTAAGQAAGYAYDAASSALTARAGIARLFPPEMSGDAEFWRHTLTGSPETPDPLPAAAFTISDEALIGDYVTIANGQTEDRHLVSRAAALFEQNRIIRISVMLRSVGSASDRLRLSVPVLRADWTLSRTLGAEAIFATTAAGVWQEVVQEITLPAALANEVWFRAGVRAITGASPDAVIEVARIRIEDVTVARQTDGFRAQAEILRNESVTARQNAENAAASAASSLVLATEVAGRGISVLSDTLLISSDWSRTGGQGVLTILPSMIYPAGRSWIFDVTAAQSDGLAIMDSPDTIWPGQTDADGYVIEVEFTLLSGTVGGAGARLVWRNSDGTTFGVSIPMSEMQAGEGLAGRSRVARAVFVKPDAFTGTFASHRLFVYANSTAWTMEAKSIAIHRVNVRPATEEEMGSGQVMAQVQAHLAVNYFTRAETNQAIADFDMALNASLNGMRASVNWNATALSNLNGSVARFSNITSVNGELRAGIEAVSFNGVGVGTGSVLKLIGDQTVAEGTLSAYKLVVFDPGNLIPDNQFQTNEGWGMPSGPYTRAGAGVNFNSIGAILWSRALATTGWSGWVKSRTFKVDSTTEYHIEIRIVTAGGSGSNRVWSRIRWIDSDGAEILTDAIYLATTTGSHRETAAITSPAGAVRAEVEFNVNRDETAQDLKIGDIVVRPKRQAATLIEPNSITTPLLTASLIEAMHINTGSFAVAGLALFGGTLQSTNFDAAAGTGWRITNAGAMFMPDASVKRGTIENLAVNTLKVADRTITTFEDSFTAGSIATAANNWTNVQSLTINKGRPEPLPLWYRLRVGEIISSSDLSPEKGKAVLIRLLRDGVEVDVQTYRIDRYNGTEASDQTFTFVDTGAPMGAVFYRLQVQVYKISQQSGAEADSTEKFTLSSYNVLRRFIGALNAFK